MVVALVSILGPIFVVLGLLLWGIKNPLAWIVVSVLFITAGVGCMVYGITDLIALSTHLSPLEHLTKNEVSNAAIFIGCGAGGAVGGAVLLFVSLLRRKKEAARDAQTLPIA
jgi:hypothetical protein